jgi:hypothetical protein
MHIYAAIYGHFIAGDVMEAQSLSNSTLHLIK